MGTAAGDAPVEPEAAMRTAEAAIRQAEIPERQQAARGRQFIHVCLGTLAVAGIIFVAPARFAHGRITLLRYDEPIERAIQSVHAPLDSWMLTQESDLGFPPLNVVSYVGVFGLLMARVAYRCGARGRLVGVGGDRGRPDQAGGGARAPFSWRGTRGGPCDRLQLPIGTCHPIHHPVC